MQKQQTQKHDAGETARERLADINKILCLRRIDSRQYHKIALKARREFLQHPKEYELHGMAIWCILSMPRLRQHLTFRWGRRRYCLEGFGEIQEHWLYAPVLLG